APEYRIPAKRGERQPGRLARPDPTDFGDVARTQHSTRWVTLKNNGSAPLTGLAASVATPFEANLYGFEMLAPWQACSIMATFLPSDAGPVSENLNITTAQGVEGSTQLIGNSVALLDDVELTDAGWFFGHWALGETSSVKQLGIRNLGTGPVTITQLYLVNG